MLARFVYGMVVVVRKEVGDAVRICESAAFIKGNGQRTVARTHEHGSASACIPLEKIFYQYPAISLPLESRVGGNVLYLENIFRFTGNDTGGFYVACLRQDEHFATFQITVYHGLLFVGQE